MEPIKQEIINNIFENGDKLITGPILQTVLIDMIDDVNVKDQEILSKTGSWDNAVTQIPNLATKEEVTNLSESVARDLENVVDVDLTGYATEQWVQSQGYLKEHQDISGLATKTELTEAKDNLQGNITSLSESVARDLANVDVDLTGYATEQWVESKGYLTEHQDISNLATKAEVTNLSESVARDLANVSVPEGVATEAWVQSQDYASKSYVDNAVSSSSVDLTGYATETWVQSQGYLKEHQDISNLATKGELNEAKNIIQDDMIILSGSMAKTIDDYTAGLITEIQNQDYASKTYVNDAVAGINLSDYATKSELTSVSESVQTDISNLATKGELNAAKDNLQGNITSLSESVARDLTGYATEQWVQSQGYLTEHQDISNLATKTELTSVSESVQTDITNLSESVANSAVWKKGTGTDSIVQILTGANEASESIATGRGAVAIGLQTTASGSHSHAEGLLTTALGGCSHAEGIKTMASGSHSHAEGHRTTASGPLSHAEGASTEALGYASHAEGNQTLASGAYSHAEGVGTTSSGDWSHAEGERTEASGRYSHAEGYYTIAANLFEHAQGQYNHNSTNQIFSVGAGEGIIDPATQVTTETRRNAISVLAVKNNDKYTASFFVQNVGGYDGTNPTPGTNDLATVINEVSSIWKKGEGSDSIVQKLTGGNEANTPTASGIGAIAIGTATTASGNNSHAEGQTTVASGLASHAEGYNTIASAHCSHAEGGDTKASGSYSHAEGIYTEALGQASHTEGYRTTASKEGSHAEGIWTNASGSYSHAEGYNTIASNDYEHAQGQYNHNSTNQIFSIGAGENVEGTTTRRNAISVLAVPNSETQINTASVFVQNIGGYDGTNPTPGTNDLATVINGLSSSGGSSETLWKKGTGTDSIVQKLTGNNEANTSTASGLAAVAIGFGTTASGQASYAEGARTIASGHYSHAEGYGTVASNFFEHAQGMLNDSSENQIFSVGAGDGDASNPSTVTRRNAISVLAVRNNDSYTSSFFVQNIGGYDGTNPTPGTNDLATVINNLPSGGGSSETLWKKGEGTDSIVQVRSGALGTLLSPKATGEGAIATGQGTKASGKGSHAEGSSTTALEQYSHAEGNQTTTSGQWSHAEGYLTNTSNDFEHAQGRYNHNSENQIFSIGTGNSKTDRRNAVSVLEVSNNNKYTSSFFVQNVGGYDGTNPLPGTNDLATVINGLSSGGGSSSGGSSETLWKKGTGTDSIVQKLTGDNEAKTPTATGLAAVATGLSTEATGEASHAEGAQTKAPGYCSHAEGLYAKALEQYSHAEGSFTVASGQSSHAEGYCTTASNDYEHAQGQYNHNSTNQIFSVGAGEYANGTETRRNAISVLVVPNSETQVVTSSFFVQNVGGYDGTNPLPGTNDLATVISNLPSGGTSSETWTFTLEDGSTVTKNIVMR